MSTTENEGQTGAVKIVPNEKFLDGVTPTINWDGQQWPIPKLAPRENRFVLPAVLRLRPMLAKLRESEMTAEQFDDLTSIIFWGLKRAHPLLRRDYFDSIAYGVDEMFEAVMVIALQTGTMKLVKKVAEDKESEGEAEVPAAPQTGT